jgi:fumarylacetoacetate (FAA) hydrolase family protein
MGRVACSNFKGSTDETTLFDAYVPPSTATPAPGSGGFGFPTLWQDLAYSTAIGPFLRLFDDTFTLDDVRAADITLQVEGTDGFAVEGVSSMSRISRDPEELVAETLNRTHQYPDGVVLFLGTMFVPTKEREGGGGGFTHKEGDVVAIRAAKLGTLVNRVGRSDGTPEWTFGTRALMANLAARGLIEAAVRPGLRS